MIVHITTGYHWDTAVYYYTTVCSDEDTCEFNHPVCQVDVWAKLEDMARMYEGHGPIDWRELNKLVLKMFSP